MTFKEAFKIMIETGEYKNILPIITAIMAVYGAFYGIATLL